MSPKAGDPQDAAQIHAPKIVKIFHIAKKCIALGRKFCFRPKAFYNNKSISEVLYPSAGFLL